MQVTDLSDNLEEFRRGFREEARELIVDLEACLLALNERRDDSELIGRVFRALHTIKGSGAMFGFDALAAFTHNLETAFDQVRQGRLVLCTELLELTLAALDQIRLMIEEEPAPAADAQPAAHPACVAVAEQLRAWTNPENPDPQQQNSPGAPEPAAEWAIEFRPGPELLRNGSDPLVLIRELSRMGELWVRLCTEGIPALADLDPERCYVAWSMALRAAVDENAIRDVFIFVEDSCALSIQRAAPVDPPQSAEPVRAATESPEEAHLSQADRIARGLEERRRGSGRRDYDKPENAASLRVPAARLDQLVNLVGELVTVQARLAAIAARSEDPEFVAAAEEIERLTSALRDNSMSLRMIPIRGTFERFRRLVHDLARDLGKQVELVMSGADTELDKTVIEQLGDPLMHLIRNSMDHGIEPPAVRASGGKPAMATIHLAARHAGGSVVVEVSDDGGGIDAEAVHRRAIERGLVAPDTLLSEAEILSLIFQPGFSTAKQVTDLSGRGVGMDVVRQRVESLHGSVEVTSSRGAGTTIALRLPLTLAIIEGLLVRVGEACFVLPLASTLECVELNRAESETGAHLATVRGELLPWIRLREYFGTHTPPPRREQIMIVASEGGRCGLVVDQVLGNCQAVIRSIGRLYRNVQIVSGATILGDGTVALILDPHRLVQEAARAQFCGAPALPHTGPGRGGALGRWLPDVARHGNVSPGSHSRAGP
jgi:two-component system chemotaxis sensor kinase CheA